MSDEIDYRDIARQFDKGVTISWDRMIEETMDLFREHCENRDELEDFFAGINDNEISVGGLTTDLFQIAYERLIEEEEFEE